MQEGVIKFANDLQFVFGAPCLELTLERHRKKTDWKYSGQYCACQLIIVPEALRQALSPVLKNNTSNVFH